MAKKKKNRSSSKKIRRPRIRESDRVADGHGPPCPRCGEITRRWRWPDYRARAEATGKMVYRWWFQCVNPKCRTKQIMPDEAKFDPREPDPIDDEPNLAHFREI
jgi:hypothetical protein